MKSGDNSRAKKSKKRKSQRGLLARVFGALICRTRRPSSLSTSPSQSSDGSVGGKQTPQLMNDGSSSTSSANPRNDDIRLEKSTQTLGPNEVATIARYYDQNPVNVDANNVRASVGIDYGLSALNRQRASGPGAGTCANELSSGESYGSSETPSSSLSSTSSTPVKDRDVMSFFDGDPRERDYIVQCSRNIRDPTDLRRLIDVKTKDKDTFWAGGAGGVGGVNTNTGVADTGGGSGIGTGRECCNGTEQPSWYCERMKTSVPRRSSYGSTTSSSMDDDGAHRSYEAVVEPVVHQLSRSQPRLRILPANMTAEEKKRCVKIVAVILATAGVAALIMLLLRYKRAGCRRRRGVVCSDLCNEDGDLGSASSSTIANAAGATVGTCDDDNDIFDDEGTCVYEKFDRVKCSNSNFKGLVCKSEKLRESDNTVCASHDFRKVTKRLKEPRASKPSAFTRLEKDRICDAKKCFETL